MDPVPVRGEADMNVKQMSTIDIVGELASRANVLLTKELALARSEMKEQMAEELEVVKGMAVAAVAGLVGVNLLFVAAVFALAPYVMAWAAALVLAAVMLVLAAVLGSAAWRKHVAHPLDRTRRTLSDDLRWVREELT